MHAVDKDWLSRQPELQGDDQEIDLASLPKCPECGYILYKAPHARCPECGTSLRIEDIAPSADQIEILRRARNEQRVKWAGIALLVVGFGLFLYSLRYGWSFRICMAGPLTGVTLAVIARQLYLGESIHVPLLCLGVSWLFAAVLSILIGL